MQSVVNACLASLCCNDQNVKKGCPGSSLGILQSFINENCDPSGSTNDDPEHAAAPQSQTGETPLPAQPPVFRLPISYLAAEDQHSLTKPVIDDLELITAKDPISTRPLYARVTNLSDGSIYGKQFLHLWSETFTSNVAYLKNTQQLISNLRAIISVDATSSSSSSSSSSPSYSMADPVTEHEPIETFWKMMKTNRVGFKDKFGYIDAPPFPFVDQLNTMPTVLQILSIYNVSTPLISLLMPVLLLIVPFFILKARGVDIDMDKYTDVLKTLISTHAVGKLFTEFDSVSMEKKMYILMSVAFYFIQVYQNTMACYRFYKNIYLIHDHLIMVRTYLSRTIAKMNQIAQCGAGLRHYTAFGGCLDAQIQSAQEIYDDLLEVEPFSLCMSSVGRIGHSMKYYYQFFNDADVDNMMQYTFGFNAYYEHLCGIIKHIDAGALHPCTFCEDATTNATTAMKEAYFLNTTTTTASAGDVSKVIVKNDIALDKKLIITGPNAAGKTTIIKTTLFNIILSQQIGYGAYSSATIAPYQFLHCYLNIPDTSGRDSLFQAESRRCKEILDCIIENPTKRHFCIFDELYSGTNPYEAVASAYGYIDYISNMRNVDFMLTTHYIQLCELFRGSSRRSKDKSDKPGTGVRKRNERKGNPNIRNLHMETSVSNTFDYTYHYKIIPGISKIKGGIKVLFDLKYPDAIIQSTKSVLDM